MDKGNHRYRVFFDFDNTVTRFDVLDDIIQRFAINDDWVKLEQDWKDGKIGSCECLRGQLKCIRVSKPRLCKYLNTIKVDPYFEKILLLLKEREIEPIIVSDNFSFIIKYILRNNGIEGLKIYSNAIRFVGDRLIPLFPHKNKICLRCGNCKVSHIHNNGTNDAAMVVYIGDGQSDIGAAWSADLVFAKDSLLSYFRDRNRECVPFRHLGEVYRYFVNVKGCFTK